MLNGSENPLRYLEASLLTLFSIFIAYNTAEIFEVHFEELFLQK